MKIKFIIKCHECNATADFEHDTDEPYCYLHDTGSKLAVIDIRTEDGSFADWLVKHHGPLGEDKDAA